MKIISKYKDYYDYLTGVYGIDEKIVYDRRFSRVITPDDMSSDNITPVNASFSICNSRFDFWRYKGKWYHTPEELDEMSRLYDSDRGLKRRVYGNRWERSIHNHSSEKVRYTDANIKARQPVLISGGILFFDSEVYKSKAGVAYAVPILKDFPIPKYLDAETIYKAITEFMGWLKDNPEIPNKQTNEEKIVSHGFDLKDSFRPKKKR